MQLHDRIQSNIDDQVFVLAVRSRLTQRIELGRVDPLKSYPKLQALYSLFGIRVAGICSIQLMELATRSFSRRRMNGLAKCIDRDLPMTLKERSDWKMSKEKG